MGTFSSYSSNPDETFKCGGGIGPRYHTVITKENQKHGFEKWLKGMF
jgi:hypothetical protein